MNSIRKWLYKPKVRRVSYVSDNQRRVNWLLSRRNMTVRCWPSFTMLTRNSIPLLQSWTALMGARIQSGVLLLFISWDSVKIRCAFIPQFSLVFLTITTIVNIALRSFSLAARRCWPFAVGWWMKWFRERERVEISDQSFPTMSCKKT